MTMGNSSSSARADYWDGTERRSRKRLGPNFDPITIGKPLDPKRMAEVVQFCLREDLTGCSDIEKTVARAANSNIEAARNWLGGRNAPNTAAMFNMMRAVDGQGTPILPTLRSVACRLLEVPNDGHAELHPNWQKMLAQAAQLIAAAAGQGRGVAHEKA